MSIADERAEISARLAPLLDASAEEVEAAIVVFYERPPLERRNLVSVLATAEHFRALLSSLGGGERRAFLAKDARSTTRRDKALTGELDRVSVAICDQLAGPRVYARLCVRADPWRDPWRAPVANGRRSWG